MASGQVCPCPVNEIVREFCKTSDKIGGALLVSTADSVDDPDHGSDSPDRRSRAAIQGRCVSRGKLKMDRKFLFGATLAVGAVLLVPGVAAAVGRAARPVVRAALKTGTVAYDEFRRAGAEVYENMEDIAAELRAEMQHAEAAGTAATAAESAGGATDWKHGDRG